MKNYKVTVHYQRQSSSKHDILAENEVSAKAIVMNHFSLSQENIRIIRIEDEGEIVEVQK